MATFIYPLYKDALLDAAVNISLDQDNTTDGVYCALVGSYTYNASHAFYTDLSDIVNTDQRITTPTVSNGTFDGDDLSYTSVTGSNITALILYRRNSGSNTTWRL